VANPNQISAFLGRWGMSPVKGHSFPGGTPPNADYVTEFSLSIPGETGKSHEETLHFKAVLRDGKPVIQFRVGGNS
jgi:hypothetical protein